MSRILKILRTSSEAFAAALMAAMFATFILQVAIRYTARMPWVSEHLPWLEPSNFGWTLEFCLATWVWLIFWGNAFVVQNRDHVTFDVLYVAAPPHIRRVFAIITGLAIAVAVFVSIFPTWDRFVILRLKRTATLGELFGDWVRMRDIYIIYIIFLVSISARYFWQVWRAYRYGVEEPDLVDTPRPKS